MNLVTLLVKPILSKTPITSQMVDIEPDTVINPHQFLKCVGSGASSSVYVVKSLNFGCEFVAKVAIAEDGNVESAWNSKYQLSLQHFQVLIISYLLTLYSQPFQQLVVLYLLVPLVR